MKSSGSLGLVMWGVGFALLAAAPLLIEAMIEPELPRSLLFASLIPALLAIFGAVWFAVRAEDSISVIENATVQFSGQPSEFAAKAPRSRRLRQLAEAFNTMAVQLRQRLDALSQLSSEQDAILRSMTEGVVTIDSEGRICRVNDAARNLLGMPRGTIESKLFRDVVQHDDIRRVVAEASASMLPKTGTVVLRNDPETILDIYGSPLFQADGSSSGTLIVFRDMTRVHKLENVRRDFVANVSHELRTPITSIKGFTETLLDGAMNEPETLKKFLAIIGKQSERLHAIFNDLLTLARLEAGNEDEQVEVSPTKLADLVREAMDACSSKAASKQIALNADVGEEFRLMVNPSLIQQALVNLIDNAIKYSDSGASVTVKAEREGDFVRCVVADTGPGIESSHLPRLFERFYRVDQGRSRQMGGTGLGLAIVKHIAHVHGGRVDVQSTLGRGSEFSLFLKIR
jgi:two-component system phosphate regulon sensor histidine kinase PhoR